ncbi:MULTISPECIES: type IV pilus modification protein PilV [Polaromonas]|uniref:Type IV pilus modification protein PilV n=1 Tax=Polaromonas aquatica TaxID=332657 RepID=A0ABW1U5Q0_9BURK
MGIRFITVAPSAQKGASLLEVLIAIVIMSFGLLAMGGLTAASIQYGKMAQFQTVGVQLASDYADRMRANADGFMASAYDKTAVYSSVTTAITVPTCAVASKCTSAELAAIDVAEWRNSLRTSLPGGDAYVLRDTTNPPAVDIWVMWADPSLKAGTDTSLITAGSSSCPAAALSGSTVPHCLYFRAGI